MNAATFTSSPRGKMNVFFTIMLLHLKAAQWTTEISPVNGRFTGQGLGKETLGGGLGEDGCMCTCG